MARLRRITRCHEYDKRDGGFLQRAVAADGRVISGDKLHRKIMAHYTAIHNRARSRSFLNCSLTVKPW
jgi:hypothetical protein